jgi:predicted TIM-barrel fold metal-dependent hydrolase
MIFDVSAFTGNWPFRRLSKPKLSDLLEAHKANGITGGLVSCLESVFYNDPEEGDRELAQQLPKGYLLALSHNPMLPFALEDLRENRLNAAAVRLYPCYHKYRLSDSLPFCRKAGENGLVICIMAKMDDIRLDYLWLQTPPAVSEVMELAKAAPETRFILSGITLGEIYRNAEALSKCPNLYFDLAFSGDLAFGYEKICSSLPIERLLFGTYFPLQCIESNCLAMETADIGDEARKLLACGNAARLFGIEKAGFN